MRLFDVVNPSVGFSYGRFPSRASVRRLIRLKTFHRRPSLDQRAVDREVVRAEQPLDPRLRQNHAQQLGDDVAFQQPIAVPENVE